MYNNVVVIAAIKIVTIITDGNSGTVGVGEVDGEGETGGEFVGFAVEVVELVGDDDGFTVVIGVGVGEGDSGSKLKRISPLYAPIVKFVTEVPFGK
jgi:hypothetical protein